MSGRGLSGGDHQDSALTFGEGCSSCGGDADASRPSVALSLISYSKPEGEHAPIRHKVREILLKVVSSTLFSDLDVRIICHHLYNTMFPGGLFGKRGSKMGKLLHSIAVPDEVALPVKITNALPPSDEHARNMSSQIRSVLRDASEILIEELKYRIDTYLG